MNCPYPGCERELDVAGSARVCGCNFGEQLKACPSCGIICREQADFCRACQTPVVNPPSAIRSIQNSPASVRSIPGVYYQPPGVGLGHLWLLDESGSVSRLSPFGANARVWAEIPSKEAGYNAFSVSGHAHYSLTGRGSAILAIEPQGVHAVSLVTGEQRKVLDSGRTGELVCNARPGETTRFAGLAASKDFYCCLERAGSSGQATLVLGWFAPGRASERPLTISGRTFLGPVTSGQCVGICSEDEIWILDAADGFISSVHFTNFEPFFSRPSQVNVPQGGMPFAIARSAGRTQAWLGGLQSGVPGILHANFEKQAFSFTKLPDGAAFGFRSGAGLWVNTGSELRLFGQNPVDFRLPGLESAMPAANSAETVLYFSRPGQNALRCICAGTDHSSCAPLPEKMCNEDTCCGIFLQNGFLVVSYFGSKQNPKEGMSFSGWDLRTA